MTRSWRKSKSVYPSLNLDNSTPLWVYVLNEGLVLGNGGRHLGPVGGRIVGEVFIGLLQLDRDSYLNAERRWKPTLPQRSGRVPELQDGRLPHFRRRRS